MHHQKQKNMNNLRNMQKVTPEVIERLEFILNELEKENCALEIKVELHKIKKKYDLYDCIFEENDKKGVKDIKGNIASKNVKITKIDNTIPEVTISATNKTNKSVTLKAIISPITTASGYTYEWYKNGNKINGVYVIGKTIRPEYREQLTNYFKMFWRFYWRKPNRKFTKIIKNYRKIFIEKAP